MTQIWLVTGAAGFIGSNLSSHLLEQGATVIGFDNFMTGKQENIRRLKAISPNQFHFIEGDITDSSEIFKAADGCDFVVHLAAQVSVQRSIDNMVETNSINVDGFLNTYNAALKGGARHFVYASSCAIYGDNSNLPLREKEIPVPMSPYAVSKLANEYYASVLTQLHPRMNATGLRFFNIYGPWQDPSGGYAAVIPKWIATLLNGSQPMIFGDGSATRDFCYVKDLCKVITITASKIGGEPHHRLNNVGSGTRVSMDQLYKHIAKEVARVGIHISVSGPIYEHHREGDILHSYADITQVKTDLGFQSEVNLAEGIALILKQQYSLM